MLDTFNLSLECPDDSFCSCLRQIIFSRNLKDCHSVNQFVSDDLLVSGCVSSYHPFTYQMFEFAFGIFFHKSPYIFVLFKTASSLFHSSDFSNSSTVSARPCSGIYPSQNLNPLLSGTRSKKTEYNIFMNSESLIFLF